MNRFLLIILIVLTLVTPVSAAAQNALPDQKTLRKWIVDMKNSPRGPFQHIRWFCNDGTIQLPKAFACRERGGGVQHGEWLDRVELLRANGYTIGTIFADINPPELLARRDHLDIVKQMLLEQFLINSDDGWIFRKARYYRGALQAEDEVRQGRELLLAMVAEPEWRNRNFLVLREAVKLFPHGRHGAPISEMRQLSLVIAEQDQNFKNLRIKIHVRPEFSDAQKVRDYAPQLGIPDLSKRYEELATLIEKVFQPADINEEIRLLARLVKDKPLANLLDQAAGALSAENETWEQFKTASRLLTILRNRLSSAGSVSQMLYFLDAGLALEDDLFRLSTALLKDLSKSTRRQRLNWLKETTSALYGTGIISERQWGALKGSMDRLIQDRSALMDYNKELGYASSLPGWADRTVRFHFSEAVDHFGILEPITRRYIHDRLRGSLLIFYTVVIDSLMADANEMLGVHNSIFNQTVDVGLRSLNPGLARGVLMIPEAGRRPATYRPDGIYVLPATTEDLPPVSGILTTGKGNMLSHIQLLARNLGIPNVAFEKRLLPLIRPWEGKPVVLAVSPKGIVQLTEDNPEWDVIFSSEPSPSDLLIRVDFEKLDLSDQDFKTLSSLGAVDSGRIVGPKAANLGELKQRFPEAVTEGVVIPFGVFRSVLSRPLEPGGPSVFRWMRGQYAKITSLNGQPQKQHQAMEDFLKRIREWIINVELGEEFQNRLRMAMEKTFGLDGTYGVFVRSDTNVEDLPGFTGAGLNLTVPNVVGFENIPDAIRQVWASPFTQRAYRWRQAYMKDPEHVYASVLLMKSVAVEKSGVMITADVDSGQTEWLTIAVNEGVGGAVSGQTAEELRVNMKTGWIRLMSQATEPNKWVLLDKGGVGKVPATGSDGLLNQNDIRLLIELAEAVPKKFPRLKNAAGQAVPADIEFGIYQNRLTLFQIRPFLESARARQNLFLNTLDQVLNKKHDIWVNMDQIP